MYVSVFTFLFSSLFLSAPIDCDCITDVNDSKIQQIIFQLKEKWDKIQSIDAQYILVVEDYKQNSFKQYNFIFKLQGNNLYRSFFEPANKVVSIQKNQYDTNLDTPRNLWELFIKNTNKKKDKYPSLDNYEYVTNASYFFNNKFYFRAIFHNNNNKESHVLAFPMSRNPLFVSTIDLRFLWGAVPYKYKNDAETIPYTLWEFFEQKGKFCYKEKDGYRILWHEAYLDPKDSYETPLEVWFDEDNNLTKVRNVAYLGRTYSNDIDKIKTIIGKDISCDFPENVIYEITYYDFHPLWEIPLKMESNSYSDVFPEDFDLTKLYEEYESGKISRMEYRSRIFSSSLGKKKKRGVILVVNKDSLKVNIPISEKEFIPPVPNRGYDLELEENNSPDSDISIISIIKNWTKNPPPILFIATCLILLLVFLILYKRFYRKK